ncbi:MAG: glycosyltransferase [Candidatus Omnitrophica bacterium]|nr:glycosyltransferase [Candidatus Omnitrophota bacterium]
MPRNVLFMIPTLDVGGTEMQLALLAKRLLQSEFRPHILCTRREGELASELRGLGIPIECLNLDRPVSFQACRQVKWFCRDWKIDILHTFLFGMDLSAVRGARSAGVRAVLTSRREIPDWMQKRHLRVQRLANRKTDLVVCNSEAVRQDARAREGLPPEKTRVILNGFPEEWIPSRPLVQERDRERVFLRPFQLRPEEKALVCIANFSPVKNHARLLDAAKKVLLQGIDFRLFLIGEGPLLEEARAYSDRVGLVATSVFLGKRKDRLEFLAECDALVLPSLSEGFPNAVLEAQALGVPVVASHVGGIPELIEHGETGWTFDPNDVNSIAKALWTVLTYTQDALRCATEAQARARAKFTAREMVSRYVALYSELCPPS